MPLCLWLLNLRLIIKFLLLCIIPQFLPWRLWWSPQSLLILGSQLMIFFCAPILSYPKSRNEGCSKLRTNNLFQGAALGLVWKKLMNFFNFFNKLPHALHWELFVPRNSHHTCALDLEQLQIQCLRTNLTFFSPWVHLKKWNWTLFKAQ